MKILKDTYKYPVITLLIVIQIYFSLFVISEFTNTTEKVINDEVFFVNNKLVCNYDANLNNKTSGVETVLSAEKIFNDNFYSRVLTIAEELGLLFFINSENNPNYLHTVKTCQKVLRSPPIS